MEVVGVVLVEEAMELVEEVMAFVVGVMVLVEEVMVFVEEEMAPVEEKEKVQVPGKMGPLGHLAAALVVGEEAC